MNTLPLSLFGRIQTIKINILPRFLFLFRCLPIFLTKRFFTKLDRLISDFIWAGKSQRARKTILQSNNKEGGLSLPNFLFYYWATNIQNMLLGRSPSDFVWCLMEAQSCHGTSLPSLLCAPAASSSPSKYSSNSIVISSLRIWNQFRQHFKLTSPSPHSPICNNHLFIPSTLDGAFASWKHKGIISFSDLYNDGIFASFDNLGQKFDLPRSSLFNYFQVRDFARTILYFHLYPLYHC